LLLNCAAMAEQFSLECAWYEPYFLTFDTEAGQAIFESPAGSALAGRVHSLAAGRIEFDLLRVGQSKLDLIWDGGEGKLTWIVPPDEPAVIHTCSRATIRPILKSYDSILPR